MPTYTFRHKKTGKTQTHFMTISEGEEWVKNNPAWDFAPAAPSIGDPTKLSAVGLKPSDSFRDKLRHIKKQYRGSTINTF